MTLHGVLEQARRLATLDPRRPRQANLRRSCSTAYYSLFHLLVNEGARRLSRAAPGTAAFQLVARKFEHGQMASVSRATVSGGATWVRKSRIGGVTEIRGIADTFVFLQEKRHAADYDTGASFTRPETLEVVERAEAAFDAWGTVRGSEPANYFLLALLIGPPQRG